MRWTFPRPFPGVPVLGAVAAGPVPLLAVVESVTTGGAVVRVWTVGGEPAGGAEVHLTARPAG